MLYRLPLLLLTLLPCHLLASSQLIVPKRTQVHTLKKLTNDGWVDVDIPKRKSTITLEVGTYSYVLSLQNASNSFSGNFELEKNQTVYLHKAITSDKERIFSWVSTAKPNSEQAKLEKFRNFCRSLNAYYRSDENLNACKYLIDKKDPIGYFELARAHSEGSYVVKNKEYALKLYKSAWDLGFEDAAVGAYYLDYDNDITVNMIATAAEENNKWALGAYANHLAFKEPTDVKKAKELAIKAAQQGNLDGLVTLARIEYNYIYEQGSSIDAAAWFNLARLSSGGVSRFDRKLEAGIMNSLYETDIKAVKDKTVAFEKLFSNRPILHIAQNSFTPLQKQGAINLIVNDDLKVDIKPENQQLSVKLLDDNKSIRFSLEIDGDYFTETAFSLDKTGGNKLCLYFNQKSKSIEVTPHFSASICKSKQITSLWQTIEYLN